MSDLAQFSALAALIVGGFGLFAFKLQRLAGRIDRLAGEFKDLRRDMAGTLPRGERDGFPSPYVRPCRD